MVRHRRIWPATAGSVPTVPNGTAAENCSPARPRRTFLDIVERYCFLRSFSASSRSSSRPVYYSLRTPPPKRGSKQSERKSFWPYPSSPSHSTALASRMQREEESDSLLHLRLRRSLGNLVSGGNNSGVNLLHTQICFSHTVPARSSQRSFMQHGRPVKLGEPLVQCSPHSAMQLPAARTLTLVGLLSSSAFTCEAPRSRLVSFIIMRATFMDYRRTRIVQASSNARTRSSSHARPLAFPS